MQTVRPAHESRIPSRRDFLARASVLGAAATTLGSTLPLVRAAHTGADDTLKLALIGCGARGTGAVAQALSTSGAVKLWAMADAFDDRMKTSLASLAGVAGVKERVDVPPERQFIGLDAYRKAIDSGVDVVLIAAPPGYRPLHFEYAVKAGKHAFIEKPVATDAPGVRRHPGRRRKGQTQGAQSRRRPAAASRSDLCRPGQAIAAGRSRRHHVLPLLLGYRPAGQAAHLARGLTELEYQVRNWYFFSWLSGDHIVEQHIHNIDVCNWVQKAQPVSAQGLAAARFARARSTATFTIITLSNTPMPTGPRCSASAGKFPAA